jgi:hypothetical protein
LAIERLAIELVEVSPGIFVGDEVIADLVVVARGRGHVR